MVKIRNKNELTNWLNSNLLNDEFFMHMLQMHMECRPQEYEQMNMPTNKIYYNSMFDFVEGEDLFSEWDTVMETEELVQIVLDWFNENCNY
jgi:hypothetical protein